MNSSTYVEEPFTGRSATTTNNFVPDANTISLETVINILVKKGICTTDEIFRLQGHLQDQQHCVNGNNFISIQNDYDRGRLPGLKRKMGKKKWTRKLGSLLFGWKWKKIKKNPI